MVLRIGISPSFLNDKGKTWEEDEASDHADEVPRKPNKSFHVVQVTHRCDAEGDDDHLQEGTVPLTVFSGCHCLRCSDWSRSRSRAHWSHNK